VPAPLLLKWEDEVEEDRLRAAAKMDAVDWAARAGAAAGGTAAVAAALLWDGVMEEA
jgi:hypothetical protein